MGWMASLGSLARVAGAVLAGGAYQNNYMVTPFLCTTGAFGLAYLVLAAWLRVRKLREIR